MRIPKFIKIGGHDYKVLYPYKFQERYDVYGQVNDTKKEIRITELDGNGVKRSFSAISVTFIHEVLHAIDFLIGNRLFNDNDGESKIEALSEAIYQILVDNKGLFTSESKDDE